MKKYGFALLAACLAVLVMPAHADKLTNSTVTGTLSFSSGSNEFTPATVTIGGGKEFSYDNGIAAYSAQFSNTAVTITVNCDGKVSTCNPTPAFVMTFDDDVFSDFIFNMDAEAKPLTPATLTQSGDLITFTFPGPTLNTATENAKYTIDLVPVPEPGSMALLGTGMLGVFAAGRRRFLA